MDLLGGASKSTVHTAALNDDLDELRNALARDPASANARDVDQRTPLHWCCVSGGLDCARFLLSLGDGDDVSQLEYSDDGLGSFEIDVNAEDGAGWTPLMIAVSAGHDSIYELLLQAPGLQLDRVNRGGQTALHFACSKNRLQAAKGIVARAQQLDKDLPADTARSASLVRRLMRTKDRQGQLSLHRAAANGNLAILNLMLDSGSPLDASDAGGWTPLHHACAESHGDCAAALCSRGADTDRTDTDGKRAVQLVQDEKVQRFLLQQCPELFS